jgi:DNA-binding winged helix-turn-helix (wHTH) protein
LSRNEQLLRLNARGAALLAVLVEANGGVVGRQALLEAAWPGQTVE